MRTSREREVIDDVVRTLRAVIDLFFADGRSDGSSALNVSTVIKMVLSQFCRQFCRGRFRLSSSLSCEAPFCLPRTGPAALACNMCCLSRRRPPYTLASAHSLAGDAVECQTRKNDLEAGPQQNTSRERCSKVSRECGQKPSGSAVLIRKGERP